MRLASQPKVGVAPEGRSKPAVWLVCAALGVVAVLAWSLPARKENAVLGYLNYPEFWLAMVATFAALSVLVIGLLPEPRRRPVGFRLGAVWVGTVVALSLVEAVAYFLTVRNQMDNPWYFAAGGGVSDSDELPFERPANLKWEGLSRGDLAQVNDDQDPYARRVTFQTDRQGFRNGEEIYQADVVAIGDSFTEAGNVPEAEAFATLIGRKLGLKSRNLGRAGYSPPTELVVLRKYGLDCRPQIVVWQIAEANDLDDALRFQGWVEAGRPRFFDVDFDRQQLRAKVWKLRSLTYRTFELLRNHEPRPWPFDGWFRDHAGVEHPMRFLNAPDLKASVRDHPGWRVLAESLAGGAALCRSNQIQLLVVLVPIKYRVLGPSTRMPNQASPEFGSASGSVQNTTFGGLLKIVCDSLGIPLIDATVPLTARAKAGGIVYLPYDTHLSPLGHEVVADVVVEKLRSLEKARGPTGEE